MWDHTAETMMIRLAIVLVCFALVVYVGHYAWMEKHAEKERVWIERHDIKQADKARCREEHRHFCWL